MNIFVKFILTLIIAFFWIYTTYFSFICCKSIWEKNIDYCLTGKVIFGFLRQFPNDLSDVIQERTNISINIKKTNPTIDLLDNNKSSYDIKQVKQNNQYEMTLINDSDVEIFNIDLGCHFPYSIIEKTIFDRNKVSDILFDPEKMPFTVSGNGKIEKSGKMETPFYNLKISTISQNGFIKLSLILNVSRDIWPKGPEHNYIAGTYSRKINEEMIVQEIYFPIEITSDNEIRIGEKKSKIPKIFVGIAVD